ncbi:MAG: hypothetical protein IPK63_10250 [Candidatus Competibacteraceae bacterium]|nr:hypothetical protein [Candidatus Competibacteraceae bacterium]
MNHSDWREFYRWLETASPEELREKDQRIEGVLKLLKDQDVRKDALRMRREIESTLLDHLSRR